MSSRYDNIANIIGILVQSFVEMHKDKVNKMKRNLIGYVKNLLQLSQQSNNNDTTLNDGQPTVNEKDSLNIWLTDNSYPNLPMTVPLQNLNKGDLTHMLQTYLAAHYSR